MTWTSGQGVKTRFVCIQWQTFTQVVEECVVVEKCVVVEECVDVEECVVVEECVDVEECVVFEECVDVEECVVITHTPVTFTSSL